MLEITARIPIDVQNLDYVKNMLAAKDARIKELEAMVANKDVIIADLEEELSVEIMRDDY